LPPSSGTLRERAGQLLIPQEGRDWEVLRSLRGSTSRAERKAARAKELVLDAVLSGIDRK